MAVPAELRSARRRALTASVPAPAPNALVAASSPVSSVKDIFKPTIGRTQNWQTEAWRLYDLCGELNVYARWRARSCSRVMLIASEIDPATGQPTGGLSTDRDGNLTAEGMKVAAIVRSIAGGPLGQAALIERAVTLLSVPGEMYMAILVTTEGERWEALSLQQIKPSQKVYQGVTITLPDGTKHEFTPANGDGMFRVWNAHPRNPSEADSPVRAGMDSLQEIARTTEKIANSDQSIMFNNGILIIPAEASLPGAVGPVSADKPGAGPAVPQSGHQTAQTLQAKLVEADQIGARDPKAQVRRTPLVAVVPAEHADKVRHITFGKDATEFEIKKRDAAVLRWIRSIDMEPDQFLGLGDTNHWNGHLLADQDVQLHVVPVMRTLCQAIWRNVIRPMLVKAGVNPDKYVLTIDASAITSDPDKSDDVEAAYEANSITIQAYLKGRGLDPEAAQDLTTRDGALAFATMAVTKDPSLLPMYAPLFGGLLAEVKFPQQALPSGAADDHGDPPVDVPVDGSPPPTEGKAPRKPAMAAAVAVATPVDIAADFYLTAAMRLAGNRRVKTNDREQRARLRDVEPHDYYRLLPPVDAADVGRLIASFDAGLDDKAAKYGFSADEVRARVTAEARRRLTSQVVDG